MDETEGRQPHVSGGQQERRGDPIRRLFDDWLEHEHTEPMDQDASLSQLLSVVCGALRTALDIGEQVRAGQTPPDRQERQSMLEGAIQRTLEGRAGQIFGYSVAVPVAELVRGAADRTLVPPEGTRHPAAYLEEILTADPGWSLHGEVYVILRPDGRTEVAVALGADIPSVMGMLLPDPESQPSE